MALRGRAAGTPGGAVKGVRPAWLAEGGGFTETTVYDRYRLAVGDELAGPAVVEEAGSTLVVPAGATARVAPSGNIVMTLA